MQRILLFFQQKITVFFVILPFEINDTINFEQLGPEKNVSQNQDLHGLYGTGVGYK